MGFRSVFITEDTVLKLPAWFLDKWGTWFHFYVDKDGNKGFPISSIIEQKMYGARNGSDKDLSDDWHADLQKVLLENEADRASGYDRKLILVWLHECGGLTRVEIHKDRILLSEPSGWLGVESVTHSYCNGCSDHPWNSFCHCGKETHRNGICVSCEKPKEDLVVA